MTARAGRDRVFARALLLSAVLHLSAVTLFRIVIYFPREDIHYFRVSIVQSSSSRPLSVPAPTPGAEVPADFAGPRLGESLSLNDPLQQSLPEIELPTLPFEELSLLRLKQEALQVRSRYDELFSSRGPIESRLRLSSGLETVSETLGRLTFGGLSAKDEDRPQPISRPAPGFEAYVEWLSEPKDRQVFDVQPIEALRGLGADAVPEPITLVFRVNRNGTVSDVFSPTGTAEGLVAKAADALSRYRFAPLIGDGPEYQGGTFILRASGDGA
jgi:hypothetical protein